MIAPADTTRHFSLMRAMAEALDVDLTAAALSDSQCAAMQERCAGCATPGGCIAWLDLARTRQPSAPPTFCKNAKAFEALMERIR